MKANITAEKTVDILKSLQVLWDCACIMDNEYYDVLVETRFSNPILNQKNKRIKSDIADIKKHILQKIKHKDDKDIADIEHPYQMLRVIKFFSTMPTDRLTEYMDGVDKMKV